MWIQYSGSKSFVADPSIATIYNPGQEYTRRVVSADGDRCEWFGVSAATALEIAAHLDPHAYDRQEKPFLPELAPIDRGLYFAQRALFREVEKGYIDPLKAEEAIIGIVTAVMNRAYGRRTVDLGGCNDLQLDLIQRAKASLVRHLHGRQSLNDLAFELDVSAFHLCRIFRKQTGHSLHEYKTDLRLRSALESLENRSADLSRIALECGFSSHSHFSAAMRARFAMTPSQARARLG